MMLQKTAKSNALVLNEPARCDKPADVPLADCGHTTRYILWVLSSIIDISSKYEFLARWIQQHRARPDNPRMMKILWKRSKPIRIPLMAAATAVRSLTLPP